MAAFRDGFRWLCTLFGFIFYLGDIGSDILLSVQYFRRGHVTWAALTLTFVLVASVTVQTFSYAWFKDDNKESQTNVKCIPTCYLIGIHLLQIGICSRYLRFLKRKFKALCSNQTREEKDYDSGLAADLSMLRMFETFLESVPQLTLQTYIILEHNHRSNLQYISMAMSFVTIAWSTVDYRRCLRSSLRDTNEMPSGSPTAIYLFYKIFTITPRILSLTLFLILSYFTIPAIALVWLVGTTWAFVEKTNFCTSRVLEWIYRAVVGVILIFTFFNIRGQNTKVPMTVYYIFSVTENLSAPILLALLKPESEGTDYFLPIILFILFSNSIGLIFLAVYYSRLHHHVHPPVPPSERIADEVDGGPQVKNVQKMTRFNHFLQI
ncbi:XK-related protein 9 isoform X1 [Danio rerio]|uniref:XK-related protein n=1 Tax=Danio rerio TaxID=7955 RepID=B3DGC8_DANRE|nr:XK-related protein 9 isoform X1 [Danio rerio]AAI62352.1 Zgc:136412 protein [Danio rerio]|eukprot:XP_005162707.1 XK-related protein 9 isoform X1 [Danio rerio]